MSTENKMNNLDLSILAKFGKDFLDVLNKIATILRPKSYSLLSYGELIKALVNGKPQDSNVVKAAVLKKTGAEKVIEVIIVYLNAKNEPVWGNDNEKPNGCIVRTEKLDDELSEMFGNEDLIIFE